MALACRGSHPKVLMTPLPGMNDEHHTPRFTRDPQCLARRYSQYGRTP